MTPFGHKVRQLRTARGMSLKQMAKDLHVSEAYLSALEHGHRGQPSPGLVLQICGYLDVIWDEVEELKRLAQISHPKVAIDTAGLPPDATELANRLAQDIRTLPEETIAALLEILRNKKNDAERMN